MIERHGRWMVIGPAEAGRVLCRCECGVTRSVLVRSLRHGTSRSCGCLQRDRASEVGRQRVTHGHAARGHQSATYSSWRGMVERCTNPLHSSFRYYGGKVGNPVRVCDGWSVFETFLADMGERPDGTTLDRLDPSGSYTCGACAQCREHGWARNAVWATLREQAVGRGANWFARETRAAGLPA